MLVAPFDRDTREKIMNRARRSLGRVAVFLAAFLPSPPSSDAPPPDVDGFRDREGDADADARKTALRIDMLRKDGRGSGR
jgi:hypothetical protein